MPDRTANPVIPLNKPEILDEGEPLLLPGEASLVDADTEVGRPGKEPGHDLRKHHLLDSRRAGVKKGEEERSGGVLPGAKGELGGVVRA